jgi:hypothetical protein
MHQSAFTASVLADGNYDAIVVDGDEDEGFVRLELAITTGSHKGEVVVVRTTDARLDPVTVLGLPARLVVVDGVPRVDFEP